MCTQKTIITTPNFFPQFKHNVFQISSFFKKNNLVSPTSTVYPCVGVVQATEAYKVYLLPHIKKIIFSLSSICQLPISIPLTRNKKTEFSFELCFS